MDLDDGCRGQQGWAECWDWARMPFPRSLTTRWTVVPSRTPRWLQYVLIPEDLSSEDEHQSGQYHPVKTFGDLLLKVADAAIFCQHKFLAVLWGLDSHSDDA